MAISVCHVITTLERGGAENQLLILVREQLVQGKKIIVIPLKGKLELIEEMSALGVTVETALHNKSFWKQCLKVRKLIRSIDIVHLHLPRAEILSLFMGNIHRVHTRHNAENFFPHSPRFISTFLSRLVTSDAHGVIAISRAVYDFLIRNKEVKLISRIHIVHYGYDKKRSSIKKIKPIGKEKYSIGTLARLTPQKDLETLLHGFSIVLREKKNIQLIIAGDGELRESLEKLAQQLDITCSINWLGKITDTEGFLAELDAFVLTSKYEGFGLVLLEAMQANLPIVAANNSAIPEVLGENYSYLFETSNPISLSEKILQLTNLHDSYEIEKFFKFRLNIFNPEKMEEKVNRLYESILAS